MSGDPFFPGSQQFQVPPTIPRAPMYANSMPPQPMPPMPPMPSEQTPFTRSAPPAMFGEGEQAPFYRRPSLGPMPPFGPPDSMGPPQFASMPVDKGQGKGGFSKGESFPFGPPTKGKGKGEWDMVPPPDAMFLSGSMGLGKGKGEWDPMMQGKGKGEMQFASEPPRRRVIDIKFHPPMPASASLPQLGPPTSQGQPSLPGNMQLGVGPTSPLGTLDAMPQGQFPPHGTQESRSQPAAPYDSIDFAAPPPQGTLQFPTAMLPPTVPQAPPPQGTSQFSTAMPPPTIPQAVDDDDDPLLEGVTPRSTPHGTMQIAPPPQGSTPFPVAMPQQIVSPPEEAYDDADATSNVGCFSQGSKSEKSVGCLRGLMRQEPDEPPKSINQFPTAFEPPPQPWRPTLPPLPLQGQNVEKIKSEMTEAQKASKLFQLQQFTAYMFTLLCFVVFAAPTIMCLHLAYDPDVAFWIGTWGNLAWFVPVFLVGQHLYHTWMISKSETRRRYLFIIVPIVPCVLFMFVGGTYMSFSRFLYGQLKADSCGSADYLNSKFLLQEAYDEAHAAWDKCVRRQQEENQGMPLRRLPVLQSCKEWVEMESEDKTPIPWKGYDIPQGQIRAHNPDNFARWQYLADAELNHVCGGFCEAGPSLWVSYRDTGVQGGPCSQYVAFRFLSVMHTATIIFVTAATISILSFPIYFSSRSYLFKLGYLSDGSIF